MSLESDYRTRFEKVLAPTAASLQGYLQDLLEDIPRIDRVAARPKGIQSFLNKAEKEIAGKPKYENPLFEIQDQIGARIITFYREDADSVSEVILKYLRPIEDKDKTPESEWEFGYFGRHFILFLPNDVVDPEFPSEMVPQVFELQVKTLFQHAWSEADHDLGYKPGDKPFLPDENRMLALASAQAWGADMIFSDLYKKRSIE